MIFRCFGATDKAKYAWRNSVFVFLHLPSVYTEKTSVHILIFADNVIQYLVYVLYVKINFAKAKLKQILGVFLKLFRE